MYSETQKQAIYNWRKKNKEKYLELQKEYGKKYYNENIEKVREKARNHMREKRKKEKEEREKGEVKNNEHIRK